MPAVRRTGKKSSEPPTSLIVYVYGAQRKLGPRCGSYKATVELCRKMFLALPANNIVTLSTKDLDICNGQLTEIYHESWNGIVDQITEVVVMSDSTENVGCVDKANNMTIYVETNDGIIPISASPNLKVKAILAAVRNKRTPTDDTHTRSYLILDGSRMHEDRRLVDYDITTGDTLVFSREVIGGKPVIYLMAPEAIDASVELSLIPQWSLSAIYPVVPIKPASSHSLEKLTWRVQIHPNGELTEVTTGLDTAYLFWEAITSSPSPSSSPATPRLGPGIDAFDPTNAVLNDKNAVLICVENITPYLDATLKALGLHTEARSSFITYWLPALLKHVHVALRFLPQASYEQAAMLSIFPSPDVVTRVFMIFQGIEESDLKTWSAAQARADQDISFWVNTVGVDVERTLDKGLFRVIEWGGMEVIRHG